MPTIELPASVPLPRPSLGRRIGRLGAVALLSAATLAVGAGSAAAAEGTGGATAEAPQERTTAVSTTKVRTLKQGSRGTAVKNLQRRLGQRADGHFGPATKRALKRWQKRNGLKADGVAGAATLRALGLAQASSTTPPPAEPGAISPETMAALQKIAQCESGGNPTAVSSNGTYRGKYQFSRETWKSMGGTGDPAAAPEAEQDRLAAKLYEAQGTKPWPVCGKQA